MRREMLALVDRRWQLNVWANFENFKSLKNLNVDRKIVLSNCNDCVKLRKKICILISYLSFLSSYP